MKNSRDRCDSGAWSGLEGPHSKGTSNVLLGSLWRVLPHGQAIAQIEACLENLWTKGHAVTQQISQIPDGEHGPLRAAQEKHEGEYAALLWFESSHTGGS